jgi:galactokinase
MTNDVSKKALDWLVRLALDHGVLGARLTGAGFWGCIVALVLEGYCATFVQGLGRDAQAATVL